VGETRVVQQAYKFELDPNEAQRVLLAKSVGARRFVYNWGLELSQREYERLGKRPTRGELQTRLVELKRSECPWLYEVSAHIGQAALKDLSDAFARFFRGLKKEGSPSGYPRFKKRGPRDSARLYEVVLEERHIRMHKIGRVRLKESRTARGIEGRILSATVRRRADRWFVSVCVKTEREIVEPKPIRKTSDVVGIDLGLRRAAVIHDGEATRVVESARTLRQHLRKLARLNRRLARKQKGSRNREKAKLELARLHYRISCLRQNQLHQLTSSLARTKSVIVVEDLHVKGLQGNKHLALSVGDAGMGELRRQLSYKSEWYGVRLIVTNRFHPSTQLCSSCGVVNERMKGFGGLKERTFDCSACGFSYDRDANAALNLRTYGLKELGIVPLPEGLREVTPVREEGSGSAPKRRVKPASLKQEASVPRRSLRPNTQKRAETLAGVATKGANDPHEKLHSRRTSGGPVRPAGRRPRPSTD
jgi:putative transposase